MIQWKRTEKTVMPYGKTIEYTGVGTHLSTHLTIERRKVHEKHADGIGYWDYTSYFLLDDGKVIQEFRTLGAAKEAAEEYSVRPDIYTDQMNIPMEGEQKRESKESSISKLETTEKLIGIQKYPERWKL